MKTVKQYMNEVARDWLRALPPSWATVTRLLTSTIHGTRSEERSGLQTGW
jgi:hypothetical protein